MNGTPAPDVRGFEGAFPDIDAAAWIAPGAVVIGSVDIGPESSVFYGAVLRADTDRITVGARSNIQDLVVAHADAGVPIRIGDDVTVGHRAVLHGATIGDGCLVGIGAVLLNGTVLGEGSIVAAGAVLLEGTVVPPRSLVVGTPGKVRRSLDDTEVGEILANAADYVRLAARHAASDGQR